MLTLGIAGQEMHPLPIRCDGVEELRSRACHPKRGTNLPPEPLASAARTGLRSECAKLMGGLWMSTG